MAQDAELMSIAEYNEQFTNDNLKAKSFLNNEPGYAGSTSAEEAEKSGGTMRWQKKTSYAHKKLDQKIQASSVTVDRFLSLPNKYMKEYTCTTMISSILSTVYDARH